MLFTETFSTCLVWACLTEAAAAYPQPYLGWEPGHSGSALSLSLWQLSMLQAPKAAIRVPAFQTSHSRAEDSTPKNTPSKKGASEPSGLLGTTLGVSNFLLVLELIYLAQHSQSGGFHLILGLLLISTYHCGGPGPCIQLH